MNISQITFSKEEMILALTKWGYSVVRESETAEERDYHRTTENVVNVYNVYRMNEKMCEWAGYGTRRIEETFRQELTRRLLSL